MHPWWPWIYVLVNNVCRRNDSGPTLPLPITFPYQMMQTSRNQALTLPAVLSNKLTNKHGVSGVFSGAISCVYASYLQEDAPPVPLPKAELHYRCLIVDGVDIALGDTVTIEVSLRERAGEMGRNRSSGSRESYFFLPEMGRGRPCPSILLGTTGLHSAWWVAKLL